MINAPRMAPNTVPRPPIRLVPPITQAAIASSSNSWPGVGRSTTNARRIDYRGHACERSHDAEHRENVSAYVYSRKPRRVRVTADRIEITAEGRVLGKERAGQSDGQKDDYRVWYPGCHSGSDLVRIHHVDKPNDHGAGNENSQQCGSE